MRFHLIGLPHTQTTRAYALDGFTQMTIRFATLLKCLGHHVILYASEENEAPCDQLVQCISKAEQTRLVGATPYQAVEFHGSSELWLKFTTAASGWITVYKQPHDVIAQIGGSSQILLQEQHPELINLEYSIGYRGVCAPYRVYQSQVHRACVHGYTGADGGRDFDTVIPAFFDAEQFPFVLKPDPYVLYCGRLGGRKGLHIACQAAQIAGVPLKVIGPGDPALVTYGDYLGTPSDAERNELMAHATAVLMPTQYLEPFGNVAAEAQLCGTPVITTDYGAFVETVEDGVSGYRCSTLGEFVHAIQVADRCPRHAIHVRARRLFSMSAAAIAYARYFARLALVHGEGWGSLAPTLRAPLPQVKELVYAGSD